VLVSVDSTDLQRATLERKDKEELTTIASALGLKASARSRKADIVDLILNASGGPSAAPSVSPDGDSGNGTVVTAVATEPAPEPVVNGAADAATEPSEPSAPSAPSEETADAGVPRRRPAARMVGWAGDSQGPTPARETASLFEAPAPERSEARSDTEHLAVAQDLADVRDAEVREADARDAEAREALTREPESGDAGEPGESAAGDVDREGGRGFDGEPGNRRRRRRGRDRDRKGEDRGDRPQGAERTERPERTDRPQDDGFQGEPVPVAGYLDLRDEGYGFLRINGYLPSRDDAYVSVRQARQLGLRKGDYLTGASRPAGRNEKNPALLRIDTVNGEDPESIRTRPRFEDLTPLFPDEKLRLELTDDPGNMTARIVDLVSPIGKGQRGLIVSPPKAGKTTVMKQIARSIETNNPEVHLIVLLVDERPEEVTDMKRWLLKGEVAASTFDRPADEHIQVAELTIERAKRMVEAGRDVVIILDGITRLARAYNLGAPATGRIMSGGIDTGALYPPKKFFGAARNVEEGGSLTILATALVETGSRMDEVIFEEFKGTGNMELRLDRKLAERRVYPAIDADASSTRHEELLFDRRQLQQVWKLRRVLSGLRSDGDGGAAAGLELLIDRLKSFKSNDEFLAEVAKGAGA
jgi:transcription termination factor Rho